MTTTNKLDLRTCPLPELCEWVAREIMGWEFWTGDGVWLVPHRGPSDTTPEIHFRSLDAVAAVEAKAREGRLKDTWTSTLCFQRNDGTWAWSVDVGEATATSTTEPEARLRAVALAWDAAKEGR